MNRRAYLASLSASTALLSGCSVLGKSRDGSQPVYIGTADVVYERDDLELEVRQETVRLGDTVEFAITNPTDSEVGLGCKNPWAIQRRSDGRWRHVTWTADTYNNLCATLLDPGATRTVPITLSIPELEQEAQAVQGGLPPGRYRFVLVGPMPYLAIDFDVLEAE